MISPNKEEVLASIRTLGCSNAEIQLLERAENERIYGELLDYFVGPVHPTWWWEHFKEETVSFQDIPFARIIRAIPDPSEKIWLMIEDAGSIYPIFETDSATALRVLGECTGFEYYLIDRSKRWLLCENHHGFLIGLGTPLVDHMRNVFGAQT